MDGVVTMTKSIHSNVSSPLKIMRDQYLFHMTSAEH